MNKKQELLDFVIGNEFITKPSLQDKFKQLFKEAVNEQFLLHVVGCSSCEEIPKESFYLGMSCEECNTPFRVVKNK